MSRYVLTQEQLDRLQDQIQKLRHLNDVKEERIKELEVYKVRVSTSEVADLIKTIGQLEDQVRELKKINERLNTELQYNNESANKIKELQMLLNEERKLREYSENFAKQIELKCAEETLIKDLTKELCQLQKAEIELENRRIFDLQKKLMDYTHEIDREISEKENKEVSYKNPHYIQHTSNTSFRFKTQPGKTQESEGRSRQLKTVIRQLQNQLTDMHGEVTRIPVKTREEQKRLKELENWLGEIGYVAEDLDNIENIRKNLNYLKNEIESKRQSILRRES